MPFTPEPEWSPEEVEAARLLEAGLEDLGEPSPDLLEKVRARAVPAVVEDPEGSLLVDFGPSTIATHRHAGYQHRHVLIEAEVDGEVIHYHDAVHGALSPVYGPPREEA